MKTGTVLSILKGGFYQKFRSFLLGILYIFPHTKQYAYKRLPRHKSGYKHFWIENKEYLNILEEKQNAVDYLIGKHPSPKQLFNALEKYAPKNVLDIGCGYGRQLNILKSLNPLFKIQGCDITQKWVDVAKQRGFDVFQLDIVEPPDDFLIARHNEWDISFCRAVMTFFVEKPEEMKSAMRTMDYITRKKVIVWEWRHVCDYMRKVYPSDKFEYHYIPAYSG